MNAMRRWFSVVLVATALVMGSVACGEGEDETNGDENQPTQNQNDPNDNQSPNGEIGECGEAAEPDFADGYDLLFSHFAFKEDSPGASLNDIIAEYLDQSQDYPIIVLVELTDIDTDAQEMTIRGGAGLHAEGDGEYRWDDELEEPDSTAGTFEADGSFEATLPVFEFVASIETEEEVLKTIITIRDLEVDATLRAAEDGSSPCVDDGELDGVILKEDVEDVKIRINPDADGIPLPQVLGEDNMNYDYSGDGEDDAWDMEAVFQAEQTVIVD